MQVKKRPFRIFKDKAGYYVRVCVKKIRIDRIEDNKKLVNVIIKNTINNAERKKTRMRRKKQNKDIHDLKSNGYSESFKDLFNDKINKKIFKIKDLEANEKLLKAITYPQRLALLPPNQRLALPPPPPPPPPHPPLLLPPPPLPPPPPPPPRNILGKPSQLSLPMDIIL